MITDFDGMVTKYDDEYSYDIVSSHLSEKKAIEQYERAKSSYPDALVELKDYDCGHWSVQIYQTPSEKQEFFHRRLNSILSKLLSRLRLPTLSR